MRAVTLWVVAGLLLAETEYRKAIETTIEPFKGLLLGVFFFTVGMGLDPRVLAREPLWLIGCAIGLIAVKAVILFGLGRLYKLSTRAAIETGLLLGPGGEFAFVAIGLAATLGIVTAQTASFTLAVVSVTMALIPIMQTVGQRIAAQLTVPKELAPALKVEPAPHARQAIVVGHGRVGKLLCSMLKLHGCDYIAVDDNPRIVTEDRAQGHPVYYGDATNPAFLKACGLMDASAVIVTIHTQALIDQIVREVRSIKPDILLVARARDAEHASHLYAIGVTDAVPETIEASLQLSEATLVGLGVPTGLVIASIHERRDEFRRLLQVAANEAGRAESRSIRSPRQSLRKAGPSGAGLHGRGKGKPAVTPRGRKR